MKFRTELKPEKFPFTLDPRRPVVAVGSCFADNIADRMRRSLWVAENPFGTLFNPVSIADAIALALSAGAESEFDSTLFTDAQGIVHSRAFGSAFSGSSEEECIRKFRNSADRFRNLLTEGKILFVTFGTAYVYTFRETGRIVGNCHKEPATLFERSRLSVEMIVKRWRETIADLRRDCPELKVVFTVSPVRHKKDGLHANTISKGILHIAVERLCEDIPDAFYFPAYELMIDDLRDYRFYADDLVHPSASGVEYIWEYLQETLLDDTGRDLVRRGEKEFKRGHHRPIIPD